MKKTIKNIIIISVFTLSIMFYSGCQKENNNDIKNNIYGSWKYETGDYTYTFNEDGTGNYNSMGTIINFTYKIEDDNISILYDGNTDPFTSKFELNEDKLNIIDSYGYDTIYKKQ